MAVLQGVTELFPVSSLGHAVILPRLLNWGVDEKAPDWLAYLVVMHLGTSIALFAFFWRDWLSFLRSLINASDSKAKTDRRTFFYVILATIPAVLVGSVFRKLLGDAFAAPAIAAASSCTKADAPSRPLPVWRGTCLAEMCPRRLTRN